MSVSGRLQKISQAQSNDPSGTMRARIVDWCQTYVNENVDAIQRIHADQEGKYLPEPEEGWPADQEEFTKALVDAKEAVYADILERIEGGEFAPEKPEKVAKHQSKVKNTKDEPEVEEEENIIDPFDEPEEEPPITPPAPDPEPVKKRVRAKVKKQPTDKLELLQELLGGSSEEDVRDTVRDELANVLEEIVKWIRK